MMGPTLERPAAVAQLRAAIYCRVSTAGQAEDGYSLDGQAAECLTLAERMPATVATEHIVREVGSGADWNLPGLLELVERAKRGEFDVLITLATSRLARDVGKLAVLQRTLKRAGVTVRYVHHTFDDSPTGQFSETMLAAVDVYERANLSLRFALGKQAKAARGLVMGVGPTPYGYVPIKNDKGRTVGYAIDAGAAAVVRRIFRDVPRMPLQQLCEALDAEGIPSPGGGAWHPNTIRGILANPAYVGRAGYGRRAYRRVRGLDGAERDVYDWRDDAEVRYADVPPLVEREQVRAAKAAMAERRVRRAGRDPDHDPFPLRGLLSCGLCGEPLACTWNTGKRYYECLRHKPARAKTQRREVCALPAVPSDDGLDDHGHPRGLDAEAWRIVRRTLLDREALRIGLAEARAANAAAARRRDQVRDLRAEIAACRKRLDRQTVELLDAETGSESEQSLRRVAKDTERTIGRLQESLAALQAAPVEGLSEDDALALEQFAERIGSGLEHATLAERQRIYRLLRLLGTVRPGGEQDIRLKRGRFAIAWTALLDIRAEYGTNHGDCSTRCCRSSAATLASRMPNPASSCLPSASASASPTPRSASWPTGSDRGRSSWRASS